MISNNPSAVTARRATWFKIMSRVAPFFLIPILSILVYWSAGLIGKGFLNGVDEGFPLNANEYYYYLHSWDDSIGVGSPSGWLGALPYYLSIAALTKVGIPLWVIDKAAYVFPVALRGYSMYYLMRTLIQQRNWQSTTAGLLSAALFMFVPVDMYNNVMIGLFMGAIPLILALFIKGSQSENQSRYVCYTALASIVGFIFPLAIAFAGFIIVLYSLHRVFSSDSKGRKSYLAYLSKTLALSFLVNGFVILPAIASYSSLIGSIVQMRTTQGFSTESLYAIAPYFSLTYVIRMIHGAYGDIGYYSTPLLISAGFTIAILAWSSILLSKNRFLPELAITGVVATLLSTGVEYPIFRSFYLAGFSSPFAPVFQTQYYYVYLLGFVYACMIGLTAFAILSLLKGKKVVLRTFRVLFLILICTSIALCAYPIFTTTYNDNTYTSHPPGTAQIANGYAFHGVNFQIPSSYYDLQTYLEHNATDADRLLVVPEMNNYYQFSWSGNNTYTSIVPWFSPIPVLGRAFNFPQIITETEQLLTNGSVSAAIPLLQALSVKYVLVPHDIPAMYSQTNAIDDALSKNPFFVSMSFGSFSLFLLNDAFPIEPVFAVPYNPVQNQSFTIDNAQGLNASSMLLPNSASTLNYSRLDSADYAIQLDAGKPFILVFDEAFSNGWIATVNGEPVVNNHFMINAYANGWLVNQTGHLSIAISYSTQQVILPSFLISIVTITGVFLFLGTSALRKSGILEKA